VIVDSGGGGIVDAVRQNGSGGMGGRKKRLSCFARHSCPNHPPPTWHPRGCDRQYYDGAESDVQASVGEGEETYDRMSLLSTLDPSDTRWNPDRLNMSNSCGSSHLPSGPIATSIIRGPPPSPSFGKRLAEEAQSKVIPR